MSTFITFVLAIISSMLIDNVVLSRFYGICPFLGVSRKVKSSLGMGIAVVFVILIATCICWPLYNYILVPAGVAYLDTVAYILVIASVDFAHYLPESITLENDKQSITILESTELNESDFINNIDADCPACLYLLQSLAHNDNQKGQLWYRDSSSTILHQDMWEENTSRIFFQYFQKLTKAKKIKHNNIDYFNPTYLVAWWDIMLSRNIGYYNKQQWYDRIFKKWNYNPLNNFTDCKSWNCLLFLNLESLFYEPDNDTLERSFTFRSNPKNIETLLQYKEDKPLLLTLTNNHFINWWFQWFTTTKQILSDNNIPYIWAWFTQEESRQIFTRESNWINFCFWSYSYDWRSTKVLWWNVTRNEIDENKIKSDIQKMRDMKCDIKIISLHRWNEYKYSPNTQQKKLAHSLIDSWADLILWGHSHIPWEFELYNWKYIFYSLWNFLFDQDRWKTAKWKEFDYFYDADLQRKNVPTYISMLIWLKFTKNLKKSITITLDNMDFSSTTSWIFTGVSEETSNNLLAIIDKTK